MQGRQLLYVRELYLVTASLIPLFLESDVLALYLELSGEDKKDTEIIRIRLLGAFSKIPCKACEKLKKMKWTDESVDSN